jgi:predicted transcriptional regulator
MPPSILELTKDLILAEIQAGRLLPAEMQNVLRRTHQRLLELKSREESGAPVAETPQAPSDWRHSITRHSVTCLECGRTFKQLSYRHLRYHDLDGRTYRAKYGIPRTQPLSARVTTARRRQIMLETKPWERAPAYIKGQATKAATAKKSARKKSTRKG